MCHHLAVESSRGGRLRLDCHRSARPRTSSQRPRPQIWLTRPSQLRGFAWLWQISRLPWLRWSPGQCYLAPRINLSVCLHGAGISIPGMTRAKTPSMLSEVVEGATPRANCASRMASRSGDSAWNWPRLVCEPWQELVRQFPGRIMLFIRAVHLISLLVVIFGINSILLSELLFCLLELLFRPP